jgi:predicted ATPase/DNA-binding winged helix-turn-helix (wHTH) protein
MVIDGATAKLSGRAFDVLLSLIERRARLVTKHELMDAVWPNIVVEENNLAVHISSLRRLLGSDVIVTVPGRGYRFAAALDGEAPAAQQAKVVTHSVSSPSQNRARTLYGRDDDLASVSSLLDRHRLVTLVGPGGVGKTRLAQAIGQRLHDHYADGVSTVELALLDDPALVATAVAQALSISVGPGREAVPAVLDVLRSRRLLLVLDNCEHVIGAARALAAALHASALNVHILGTSQEPLGLPEESVYRLDLLPVPDDDAVASAPTCASVALFAARAEAADRHFRLGPENIGDVNEICRRLDGLPLALEMAAARVPFLGTANVRRYLDERFRLLTATSRAALPRHRTLQACLAWSEGLLTPAERVVFRRLGVFIGGFTLELAQRVASDAAIDDWAVLDHLGALVDRSLVVVDQGDPPRYRMLESTRSFALLQLDAAGEADLVRARHAAAVRVRVEEVDDLFYSSPEYGAAQAQLQSELGNIRAAFEWAVAANDFETAATLAGLSTRLWNRCGLAAEAGERIQRLRARLSQSGAVLSHDFEAKLSTGYAFIGMLYPFPDALAATESAIALLRELNDAPRLHFAHTARAMIQCMTGGAIATFDAELARPEALDEALFSPAILAYRRTALNLLCHLAGRPEEARQHRDWVLALNGRTGDPVTEALFWRIFADTDLQVGDFDSAIALCRRPIALTKANYGVDLGQAYLTAALIAKGELREARNVAAAAIALCKRRGWTAWLIDHFALLAASERRFHTAAQLLGHADAAYAARHQPRRGSELRAVAETHKRISSIGADLLETQRQRGALLTEDEALALAMSVSSD